MPDEGLSYFLRYLKMTEKKGNELQPKDINLRKKSAMASGYFRLGKKNRIFNSCEYMFSARQYENDENTIGVNICRCKSIKYLTDITTPSIICQKSWNFKKLQIYYIVTPFFSKIRLTWHCASLGADENRKKIFFHIKPIKKYFCLK